VRLISHASKFDYAGLLLYYNLKGSKKKGHEVSSRSVWKILIMAGYSQCKLIVKPGLNKFSKKERLDWYLEREHWELEDWKNVIFTDKTIV
jgi:hypothetical protein